MAKTTDEHTNVFFYVWNDILDYSEKKI